LRDLALVQEAHAAVRSLIGGPLAGFAEPSPGALAGLKVLDFSTLLPGPLAGRMLAAAGATVWKIERPGGEDMRRLGAAAGGVSIAWRLLNAGKEVLELDLKDAADRERLEPLLAQADVLIEQFRPGVMARLGLGYEALSARFPRLVYCSITGYGQTGGLAGRAGHDLNYLAETGLLALGQPGAAGPVVPPVLAADIAGGSYPAVINILMALEQRRRTGRGVHLDVAMSRNLLPFAWWAIGEALGTGVWPGAGDALLTGGSPRYQLYPTSDGRWLAAAPLEDRFWEVFCEAIELPAPWRRSSDAAAVRQAVAERIRSRPAAEWEQRLGPLDACCTLVATLEEALTRSPVRDQGAIGTLAAPILPLPVDRMLRGDGARASGTTAR
jgi:crotonobetainyl-CoA:carnitine CoA-transferase CaiB-like acyl-CoA transferase